MSSGRYSPSKIGASFQLLAGELHPLKGPKGTVRRMQNETQAAGRKCHALPDVVECSWAECHVREIGRPDYSRSSPRVVDAALLRRIRQYSLQGRRRNGDSIGPGRAALSQI